MLNELDFNSSVIGSVLVGILLLVWGRRLYWLLVGCAGFFLAWQLCNDFLADESDLVRLAISIAAGVVGIFLALIIQRVAFALAGFYAGSYCGVLLAANFASAGGERIYYIIGGLVGAVLALLFMNHVIIVLSCLIGASAIVSVLTLSPLYNGLVFLLLIALGCFIQFQQITPKPVEAK